MALFIMIGLITVGVMLYGGVMLYSLKRESDHIISWYFFTLCIVVEMIPVKMLDGRDFFCLLY
jgi:hypothetical protein